MSLCAAVTGGLFRLNLGLGGMLAGTIIGGVLGSVFPPFDFEPLSFSKGDTQDYLHLIQWSSAVSILAASCAPPSNPLSHS